MMGIASLHPSYALQGLERRGMKLAVDRGRADTAASGSPHFAKTPRRGELLPLQATSTERRRPSITPFSGPSNTDMLEPGSIEGRSVHRRKAHLEMVLCASALPPSSLSALA
jgi:hypothetical protein